MSIKAILGMVLLAFALVAGGCATYGTYGYEGYGYPYDNYYYPYGPYGYYGYGPSVSLGFGYFGDFDGDFHHHHGFRHHGEHERFEHHALGPGFRPGFRPGGERFEHHANAAGRPGWRR